MKNMNCLDQGTVIRGIASKKYDGICCYGVIISASCDIANRKIKNVYYLTAIEIKEWICSEPGFSCIFKKKINQVISNLRDLADSYDLEWSCLEAWKIEDTEKVILELVPNSKEANKLIKDYRIFDDFRQHCKTREGRMEKIAEFPKVVVDCIKDIEKGNLSQFYYLPEKYYKSNSVGYEGLIVDIQELSFIPWELALQLETPGIDRRILKPSDTNILEKWKEYFSLETPDAFVSMEGTIESPCREHLMQHFSNGFIRIGIDRIGNDDYIKMMEFLKDIPREDKRT